MELGEPAAAVLSALLQHREAVAGRPTCSWRRPVRSHTADSRIRNRTESYCGGAGKKMGVFQIMRTKFA